LEKVRNKETKEERIKDIVEQVSASQLSPTYRQVRTM